MAYLDVIPLEVAKIHLRLEDDTFDTEITRMISSALSVVEMKTNHIMYARSKEYFPQSGCVRVYDYPINSVDPVADDRKGLYSVFRTCDPLTLNVGYVEPSEVPRELIDTALQIIDVWFFGAEKQVNTSLIPQSVWDLLELHKRYIL
tara:strand:- start:14203 stop:14643 length:441 start_codon:yes stop_codon:yes gene_type:complete